jgi:hypothetical protein
MDTAELHSILSDARALGARVEDLIQKQESAGKRVRVRKPELPMTIRQIIDGSGLSQYALAAISANLAKKNPYTMTHLTPYDFGPSGLVTKTTLSLRKWNTLVDMHAKFWHPF